MRDLSDELQEALTGHHVGQATSFRLSCSVLSKGLGSKTKSRPPTPPAAVCPISRLSAPNSLLVAGVSIARLGPQAVRCRRKGEPIDLALSL